MRAAWVIAAVMLLVACEEPGPDPRARAEGLYLKASALFSQGELDEALKTFEEVKQLAPDDARLPAAFGEVLLAQGRFNEALTQFQDAAAREPRRSTNWSRIGFIETQLGKAEEARGALGKAIALNAKDHVAHEALGDLHFREGKLDEAVSHWRLAAEAIPNAASAGELSVRAARELVKAHRVADALTLLQAAATPEASGEVWSEYGEQLARARRFEDAAKAYVEAAKKMPDDAGLWELAGELYVALGKPAEAIAALHESLQVKDRAVVHLALARIHHASKDEGAAQQELQRALETASGDDVHEAHELARLLAELGRKADALKLYQVLAAESGRAKDVALQVETAKLARELGEKAIATAACGRAQKADPTLAKCP